MTLHIHIQRLSREENIPNQELIRQWTKHVLTQYTQDTSVCIRIVDAQESQQLNLNYRKKDHPTNVLSFSYDLPEEIEREQATLGDIVICAPIITQEAYEQQKSTEAHWAHMLVHGLLHLLGHDHEQEEQANVMEALEIKLLKQLGYSDPYQEEETHERR